MRITFQCSTTETLEYLRTVNAILRSNREVEANCQAYHALKALVESQADRLNKLEKLESERRNRVCR